MKKIFMLAFLLASLHSSVFSQGIAARKLPAAGLPKEIKFKGKLVEAWQWKDKLGENVVVLSSLRYEEKETATEMEGQSVELFAYQYIKADTGYRLLWRMNDFEKRCELDLTAEFIKGAFSVTDLDKDDVAETVVQYKLACRSDVSTAYMKLIMHEDSVKYALRGSMWVKAAENDKFSVTEKDVNLEKMPKKTDEYEQMMQASGRYETEKDFARAPAPFLLFARRQWLKFAKESFE